MNKLEEICASTRAEVERRKSVMPVSRLNDLIARQSAPRGFAKALRRAEHQGFGLIAEIKRASPSRGLIRAEFDPAAHARDYARGGAACLSVLTDKFYFLGDDGYLLAARAACALPVLRKDFMIDPWQVRESRALGADAILMIVAALSDDKMVAIENEALDLEMDVLVEVHNADEMARVSRLRSRLVGINNRDLKSFETDLATSERLAPLAPEGALLIGESGIAGHDDCRRLERVGVRSFLVGESLMRQPDLATATRSLLGAHLP